MSTFRPSVTVKEVSIQAPLVASATNGRMAYVVESRKGRANVLIQIASELDLANAIGSPDTDANSRDFHVAKSYLAYANDLVIVRAINAATAKLGRVGIDFGVGGYAVALNNVNDNVYFEKVSDHSFAQDLAHHAGLDMSFFSKEAYDTASELSIAIAKFVPGDVTGVDAWADFTETVDGSTKFSDIFEFAPRDDHSEIALVVLKDGLVVESFIVSTEDGNRNENGENNYITDYLDAKSSYIWGFASSTAYTSIQTFEQISLQDGSRGVTPTTGDFDTAYSLFYNKNAVQFDYITEGTHYANRSSIMSNICEGRKDNIGFFGPRYADIIGINNTATITTNLIADRNSLGNSTWTAYFGNWKLTYDKYRDKNVWIPITGDCIGNKVRTNSNASLWQPAAGNINGLVANSLQIAFNPTENQQNDLYKNGINYIVDRAGVGVVIDGQRTMTNQNIGVSRIHLRDLFRYVEINAAATLQNFLQQFNDQITRTRIIGILTPFMENIQNGRGIVAFQIVCDASNNPDALVNAGGLAITIKIQGNRAVENIVITVVDTPVGFSFSETPLS